MPETIPRDEYVLPEEIRTAAHTVVGVMLRCLFIAEVFERIGPQDIAHRTECRRLFKPIDLRKDKDENLPSCHDGKLSENDIMQGSYDVCTVKILNQNVERTVYVYERSTNASIKSKALYRKSEIPFSTLSKTAHFIWVRLK